MSFRNGICNKIFLKKLFIRCYFELWVLLLEGLHGTFFYFNIGLFEAMLGGYLVLPVISVHSSFLFSSWLTHLFSLHTLPTVAQILGHRQSPPFVTLFEVYISFSHSLFREIIVHEKSLAKTGANHRTLEKFSKNSQPPWPSQNKIIHFQIPLFSLLLFLTWNSTRTPHNTIMLIRFEISHYPYSYIHTHLSKVRPCNISSR